MPDNNIIDVPSAPVYRLTEDDKLLLEAAKQEAADIDDSIAAWIWRRNIVECITRADVLNDQQRVMFANKCLADINMARRALPPKKD